MDDPGVGDELSLPTIMLTPTPTGQSNSYGYEWDKTITQDLGFAINGDYVTQRSPSQHLAGWDNITVTLKDELPCIKRYPHHEFAWSVGVVRQLPGDRFDRSCGMRVQSTASAALRRRSTSAKGSAISQDGYLRPFAITGEVSREFSDTPSVSPSAWDYAASLQYSIPYLQQNVKAHKLRTS